MRIAIVGNSGSGKSSLAHDLETRHGWPILDLDAVFWEPGRVAVPRATAAAMSDVASFCEFNPHWVVEGCYAGLIQTAMQHSPLLLFLEPGREACLENCLNRPWEPHKYKSKQEQDQKLDFLLAWVKDYYQRGDDQSLIAHHALFENYQGPKRKLAHRVQPNDLDHLLSM